MKKYIYIVTTLIFILSFTACSWTGPENIKNDGVFKIAMAPDVGGINDQSFNQSAWEGLKKFSKESGADISYVESRQASDFTQNLDKLSDGDYDLIFAVGFSMADALLDTATLNLDKNYAMVDFSYGKDTPNNVTCIMFKAEEAGFLVGYIAGRFSKTKHVGFVGGMHGYIIDQFEYGFKAGVLFAAKEIKQDVIVDVQYAQSFTDAAKGKAIATKMYNDGCDIIFHASGGVAYGIVEVAKEKGKYVIGVDRDQSYLAPDNFLTSALKNVGTAVEITSQKIMNGEKLGGTTQMYGVKNGCLGIPERALFLDKKIYDDALDLLSHIEDGKLHIENVTLTIPDSVKTYEKFATDLNKNF